jgi:acyl dehydratase
MESGMEIGQIASYTTTFTQKDFDRFAILSGDDNPIHVDPEFSARTKFGKTVAHGMLLYSTIGRCLGSLMPGSGTVQIAQELMFPNPTFVGQEIMVQLEITAFPSPATIEINTNITQSDGKMGCVGKTLVWLPGAKVDYNQHSFAIPRYESESQEHRGLKIGQKTSKKRVFTRQDLIDFCVLVDETNPIFTDRDHAESIGFRDVILPGGLLGGVVSDILGTELPGRGTNWLKQKYHFLNPAYPDDEITASVEIIRLRPEKDLVSLRSTLTNQNGEIVVDGETLVWVSDLEQ